MVETLTKWQQDAQDREALPTLEELYGYREQGYTFAHAQSISVKYPTKRYGRECPPYAEISFSINEVEKDVHGRPALNERGYEIRTRIYGKLEILPWGQDEKSQREWKAKIYPFEIAQNLGCILPISFNRCKDTSYRRKDGKGWQRSFTTESLCVFPMLTEDLAKVLEAAHVQSAQPKPMEEDRDAGYGQDEDEEEYEHPF